MSHAADNPVARIRQDAGIPEIGVHGVFAGDAYQDLIAPGVSKVITSNTIPHETNAIDIILIEAIVMMFNE